MGRRERRLAVEREIMKMNPAEYEEYMKMESTQNPDVKIPEVVVGHTPLPQKTVPLPGAPPVGKFGPVTVEKALGFGDAVQKLATQQCKAIRRLGWGTDTSVLLLDEEGFLTLRKPSGTLHKAFINTEDIINSDWVVGE